MRLLLLCVALPIAFVALGAWQTQRSRATAASFGREAADLEETAGRAAVIAARDPMRIIRLNGTADGYAAPLAAQMMRDGAGVLRREVVVAGVQQGVAIGTMTAALLALLGCGAGLLAASRVRRTGLRSRAALVASFTRIQRILPAVLGMVAVGALMAASCAVLFEAAGAWYVAEITARRCGLSPWLSPSRAGPRGSPCSPYGGCSGPSRRSRRVRSPSSGGR